MPVAVGDDHGASLVLSFGKWGGFYWYRGYSTRLCLGWFALTYIPADFDALVGPKAIDLIHPSECTVTIDTNAASEPALARTALKGDAE